MKKVLFLVAVTAMLAALLVTPLNAKNEFDALKQGQQIADFKVKTIYENEYGNAVGAEFRHVPSDFVLDILRIQSIPQGFIWVNAPPPTDGGEPHAMEHLVLGKGPKAQWVASFEDMSLSSSSAGTGQTITGYHFYASAGEDIFYKLMEVKLDALIHPDYSDEEIRREMCNMGYSVDPSDSSIRLEEKGSVYTEMVSGFEGTWSNMYMKLMEILYGEDHPLSNSSGGYPPAIRERTAEELREFHDQYYHLDNMGMVLSIGSEIGLEDCLTRTSEIFKRLEPDIQPGQDPALFGERFSAPQSAPHGTTMIAGFPHQNEEEPGVLLFAWPPALEFDFNEAFLRDCFMGNLASGESSNLYKRFIDSQTRIMDIGATSVFGWSPEIQGCPIFVGFSNVRADAINEQMMDSVRALIVAEIDAIANYADGSEELEEFNQRAANLIIEQRRSMRANLNRPPRFGYRGASFWWIEHLHLLYRTDGFRKKLTTNERLKFVEDLLATGNNFWKDYIHKWQLLTVKPYAAGAKADPQMITQMEEDREKRIEAFVDGLKKQYGVKDRKAAIDKYVAEYDAKTAAIDEKAAAIEMPGFIDNPPLELDQHLQYRVDKLPGGGNNLVATFDNITSAEIALYLDMSVVPQQMLVYLSALPTMLTDVGVIKDGQPLAYDEAGERMRQEILYAFANYDINHYSGRVELQLTGSGSTLDESVKAVEWMKTFLYDADWRVENLPRMRDAIDHALTGARNGMKGWEEYWVNNPINSYWKQDNPLLLSTGSFLTSQHSLLRVKWMLKGADSPEVKTEIGNFLAALGDFGQTANRQTLTALGARLTTGNAPEGEVKLPEALITQFDGLSEQAKALAKAAAGDLVQCLSGIPDGSLGKDWAYLCRTMSADLAMTPEEALDNFILVMETIRKKDNVRGCLVASTEAQKTLLPLQAQLVERFSDEPSTKQTYTSNPIVHDRLRARTSPDVKPVYVGLMNDNTRNGVFSNTAPCASFYNDDSDLILDFLAARMYGGGGAHSIFMKTWAAGLAYSNGLRSNQFNGRLQYYAERCPSLVQTMQFVIDELKKADPGADLAEYATAQAFGAQRAGGTYEERCRSMAEDLADGLTPDVVSGFRKKVLELRSQPDYFEQLKSRMLRIYGKVLPGLDPKSSEVESANYLMIGPEMQFAAFEEYLKTVEGPDVTLYRIYPRDFWIVSDN